MRKLKAAVSVAPFADGCRLMLKADTGEMIGADLSATATAALRADIDAAIAAAGERRAAEEAERQRAAEEAERQAAEEAAAAGPPADPPLAIPADWREFNAEDTKALAHRLGAGDDVTTKAKAVEFIEAELATRATA